MKNTTYSNYYYLCIRKRYKPLKRSNNETNYILSVMMLVTIASFGRKHVENATVVADTIFMLRI